MMLKRKNPYSSHSSFGNVVTETVALGKVALGTKKVIRVVEYVTVGSNV